MGLVERLSSKKSLVFAGLVGLSACGGGDGDTNSAGSQSSNNGQESSVKTQLPQNSIYSIEGSSCVANFFYPLSPDEVNDPKKIPIPIKKEPLLTKNELSYMDSRTNLPEGSYEIQIVCSNMSPKYLGGSVYGSTLDVTEKNGK